MVRSQTRDRLPRAGRGRPCLRERQVTQTDPSAAHWLPALEPWDWAGACRADGAPWMLHTAGLNAGGSGGDSRNTARTRVYLGTCEEGL